MSRNNLILVAHTARRSYVLVDVNADTEWNQQFARGAIQTATKYCVKRSRALLLAHNIQNRLETEYGVREVFLEDRPKFSPRGVSPRGARGAE